MVDKKYDKVNFLVVFVAILFLGYFRDETVGTDILFSYKENFYYTTFNPESWNARTDFEPGFNYFIAIWKTFVSKEVMTFIGFIFLVYTISIFIFFKKHSVRPILTVLLYILYGYFFQSMNIMRQFFCIGLILFAISDYIKTRKLVRYVSWVILCSLLFHTSSLVFLFFPFILKIRLYNNYKQKILITSIVALSLLSYNYREFVVSNVGALIMFLNVTKWESYTEGSSLNLEVGNVTASLQTIFCIIVIWLNNSKGKIHPFLLSYILGVLLYNILSCFSATTWRIGMPLMFLGLLELTYMWYSLKGKRAIFYRFSLLSLFTAYFINMVVKNSAEVIPYVLRGI